MPSNLHELLLELSTEHNELAQWLIGQGEAKGEAKGKAEGEARAVLAVLDARGVAVPEQVYSRIIGCTDLAQLDVWVRRAATAEKIDDLDR